MSLNKLTSRHSGKTSNILEIKADNKIVSNLVDIAETINEHFTNISQVLAEDIPGVDVNPEVYLENTDKSFSRANSEHRYCIKHFKEN